MSRVYAIIFSAMVLAVPAASAQTRATDPLSLQAPRLEPRALRDSLSRITERRRIRTIEQDNARQKTSAGWVAAGFAALRSYELSRLLADAKTARRYFESARDSDEKNAWALYGWALTLLPQVKPDGDLGRFGFAGDDALMQDLGLDPRSRARRAVEKAVAIDPGFAEAAQLLSRLAVETRDRDATVQATSALQQLAQRDANDPHSRLALSRAAYAIGDMETAAAAAKSAAAVAKGADAAAAHHAAARALLVMPGREDEGAQEYFLGMRELTADEAKTYYDELRGIATGGEMAQLERLPAVRAASWISTFWDVHAAMSAVTVPHRLATHFTRLRYAQEYFRRGQRHGAPTRNALLLDRPESPFDDRGVIYMRHGEPDDIVRTRSTESWVYMNRGGAPEMYHFTDGGAEGIQGFGDWYLMYNLPCDPDFHSARAVYDKRLSTLIFRCDPLTLRDISSRVRRDVNEALKTDADPPGFVQPLTATYDIYTFRGKSGWTDVVASLGIQAARMKPLVLQNGDNIYSVRTSLVVVDTVTRSVARKDTVIEARAVEAAGRGTVLLGNVHLAALPSVAMVHRVSVADAYEPTRGQLYGGPLTVPAYTGDTLMISDIVLARPDTVGTFSRGAVSLTLVPWQTLKGGSFRIFYELYNVSPGNAYTTEIKVESINKGITGAVGNLLGRRPAVSLKFDDIAPAEGTTIQQLRDATADLKPGEYKLTVTVTDQRTDQKRTRTRPVTVTK